MSTFYLQEQLEDEQEELARGIGKFERQATNISDQIRTDAQVYFKIYRSDVYCTIVAYMRYIILIYRNCYVYLVYHT